MSITVFPQSIAKQIQTDKLVFSQTANKLIFVTSTDKEIFTIYKPVDYTGNLQSFINNSFIGLYLTVIGNSIWKLKQFMNGMPSTVTFGYDDMLLKNDLNSVDNISYFDLVLRITARYINLGSSGYNSATVNLTEYSKREVQNSQYFPVNVDRND